MMMNNTKAERDRITHPATCAAIKHCTSGEITLGTDHFDCRVHAYKQLSGRQASNDEIICCDQAFQEFLQDEKFENGFTNCLMEYMDRATATQLVGEPDDIRSIKVKPTLLHSFSILGPEGIGPEVN